MTLTERIDAAIAENGYDSTKAVVAVLQAASPDEFMALRTDTTQWCFRHEQPAPTGGDDECEVGWLIGGSR